MLINPIIDYKLDGNWLQIWRKDGKDGITWDELQIVKNVVFGEEVVAIEIYPKESEMVNRQNTRHLWIVPELTLPNLKDVLRKKIKEKLSGK